MSDMFLVWVHIILFVFWLGGDIGVFAAAVWVKRPGMPVNERMLLLKLAGFVDLAPRLCMALMLPVGFTLAQRWGLGLREIALLSFWLISAIWMFSIFVAYRHEGKPIARIISKLQMGAFVAGAILMFWYGLSLLTSETVPEWLAWKIILFGLVFVLAIGIDLSFRPVISAMMRMAKEGLSDSVEEKLKYSINGTLVVVIALYITLLMISYFGVLKIPT